MIIRNRIALRYKLRRGRLWILGIRIREIVIQCVCVNTWRRARRELRSIWAASAARNSSWLAAFSWRSLAFAATAADPLATNEFIPVPWLPPIPLRIFLAFFCHRCASAVRFFMSAFTFLYSSSSKMTIFSFSIPGIGRRFLNCTFWMLLVQVDHHFLPFFQFVV